MQPIKKLDRQLANQIAAGEVVERPASVVKELLENSLDAGATRIDIEITSGGKGLIRIRDNGTGIPQDQLNLALTPHATSKISNLADLVSVRSFGFRGEALSSICSVSRFTLSSRTRESEQGWQAETEGRDMQVKLTPVALTQGTRIDVRELFFNTPARRRFLRRDKTEYGHIEEVVRKTALANFKVTITLKHNDRMTRRYRAATELVQQEQRIAAICGRQFLSRSIRLDLEHQGIELKGWLALPDYHRSQIDGQYFFVNNRPVRDKVLNHAIRQAYQPFIPEGRLPAYVLYLGIEPEKVDVNVHPTKHEVRFHDARLIHDLIVQAIEQALVEGKTLVDSETLMTNTQGTDGHRLTTENYSANAEIEQHQAYRSLLQSVAVAAEVQGVAEKEIHSMQPQQGWRYLSRLNSEYVLLEKEKELILLSIPTLLQDFLQRSKMGSSLSKSTVKTDNKKLLFPEIIFCENTQDAELLKITIQAFEIKSLITESKLTITKIPDWMDRLSVKSFCLELAKSLLDMVVVTKEPESSSANLLLTLLANCEDLIKLQLIKIPKSQFLEKFHEQRE